MSMYDPDGPFGGMPLPRGPYNKKKVYNPGWTLPPEVNPRLVIGIVAGGLFICAIPFFIVPWWKGKKYEADPTNFYVISKKRIREMRHDWMASDEMPEK